MKRVVVIWFILLTVKVSSQDPQFTQFFYNPLYLAPSFAGATEASRVTSLYRSQWAGVSNSPYTTYSFSYDHYFDQFNSGFGLLFLRDAAGSGRLGTTSMGIQYSYDFRIFHTWHVRPGIHFNYLQTGIDYEKLEFSSQWDSDGRRIGPAPAAPPKDKVGDVDVSTSLLVYTKRFWFGGAVDHLLSPEVSLYLEGGRVPLKYTAFGGVELVRKGLLLKPLDETLVFAALYRNQFIYKQLDFGLYWYKMPVVAGIWLRGMPKHFDARNGDDTRRSIVRVGDAVAFLVGYKIPTFSLGYSYDFTVSKLITSTNGSHEVSMVYHFKHQRKRKLSAIPCPSF